jgi:hypothetical protein
MSGPARIEEVDPGHLARLLERIKPVVSAEDYVLVEKIVTSLLWLTKLVRARETTIGRLRRLVGGGGSEKTAAVTAAKAPAGAGTEDPQDPDGAGGGASQGAGDPAASGGLPPGGPAAGPANPARTKRKGHGRLAGAAYPDAVHIPVPHEGLCIGDRCPGCVRGTLFALAEPAQFLRIIGQAPLAALCWDCQRLRCSACGAVYTALAPEQARGDKYDETAVSMLALLRYGLGVPSHRLEQLQRDLRTPVPASTQWEAVEERVSGVEPACQELIRQAAQGTVFHVDDSSVRILELVGKRRAARVAQGKLEHPERTGLHTTAVVSLTREGRKIAIVVSGRQHAGENLSDLLDKREPHLPPPIQMSDALACNTPKEHEVVESFCLVHARRNFVEELESFPEEGRHVLEELGRVFKVDDQCRLKQLSAQERLQTHQQESRPIMDALRAWMKAGLDEKRVEPNSGLGKAFNYMLKRWDELTVFLRLAGAPLENNEAERLLKMAIRHRNNSLFFRTQHGADVADVYMTLIYTTQLHGENPFEYLTALQRHARQVAQTPAAWLPWNYRDTLRLTAERQASDSFSRAA